MWLEKKETDKLYLEAMESGDMEANRMLNYCDIIGIDIDVDVKRLCNCSMMHWRQEIWTGREC